VTLANDNIMCFADLKGKRVSLAKAGSGTAANADLVLRTAGVRDQVKAQFLRFSEAGNALRDDKIDAFAPYVIKAAAYNGRVVTDAQSYGVPSTIMAQDSVPDETIYKIVKYVFTTKTQKYMKTVYKPWNPSPGSAAFKCPGIKHHPGALKAYKDLGLIE
jgi:TRAP-type uncharacterized transport system substrate-binding protein